VLRGHRRKRRDETIFNSLRYCQTIRTFEEYSKIRYFLFTECNDPATDCPTGQKCTDNICVGKLRIYNLVYCTYSFDKKNIILFDCIYPILHIFKNPVLV
jgi:hypothetical protein